MLCLSLKNRAFRNFDADAIREFVSHGLAVDRDQSSDEAPSGLHLKCNPAFEAEIYAMPKTGIWADDFNAVGSFVRHARTGTMVFYPRPIPQL